MTKCHFIIPAGGSGLRFGSPLPKQFIEVGGLPILMHTLRAIAPYASSIILSLSEEYQAYWQGVCKEKKFTIPHTIVRGGSTRFESVRNALTHLSLSQGDLVAIHDAVRPLISGSTIQSLIHSAQTFGAAIPYLPLTDSIRQRTEEGNSRAIDRSQFVAVQTPQVFRLDKIRSAYTQASANSSFTDDASVYEALYRDSIQLILSNEENKKITHPHDLLFLEEMLQRLPSNPLVQEH